MIRVDYKLMAKGKRKSLVLFNGQVLPLVEPIDAVYYSTPGYVIGSDEEACLIKIREKVKNKYIGFQVIHQEQLKLATGQAKE
ncbi:MAG: hypothetical protein ABII85_01755 [Bacillota bacterium]